MARGDNNIGICATVELKQLVEKIKHEQKLNMLHNSFFMARDFLIKHKKTFIEMFGKKKYDEELKRWSRTQNELRDKKVKEKQKRIENMEKKLEIEKMKAEAYTKQVNYFAEEEETEIKCHKCGQPLGSNDKCSACRKKLYEDALKKRKGLT